MSWPLWLARWTWRERALRSLPAASPGAELSWLHPQSAAALISAEHCQFGAEWSANTVASLEVGACSPAR